MDESRIFIANLSKGSIGEGASALLGSLLTTQFQRAAMARVVLPEHDRVPFHFYADEFQSFANEAFATVLSEARKYRLALTFSHQFPRQIPDRVREAILANVDSIVSFRLGEADAGSLPENFPRHRSSSFIFQILKCGQSFLRRARPRRHLRR